MQRPPRLTDEEMPPPPASDTLATSEMFRLRRHTVVDAASFVGFVAGFAVAGIWGFRPLSEDVSFEAGKAMFRYIATMFAAGLGLGLAGMAIGHVVASVWERVDLRLHPRRYERE